MKANGSSVEFTVAAQGGRAALEITGKTGRSSVEGLGNTKLEPEVSFLQLCVDIKENYWWIKIPGPLIFIISNLKVYILIKKGYLILCVTATMLYY